VRYSTTKRVLTTREAEICGRLRWVRRTLDLSQYEVARKLAIPRNRLAIYEAERAPLRAALGLAFCLQLNVNERWLATGQGCYWPCLFPDLKLDPAQGNVVFSAVYDLLLDRLAEEKAEWLRKNAPGSEDPTRAEEFLPVIVRGWLQDVPKEKLWEFVVAIDEAGYDILDDLEVGRRRDPNNIVDDGRTTVTTSGVTFNLPETFSELLVRLKRATAIRGRKAELARRLRVPRQRLNEWLAGRHLPGAEVTLRILNWVKDQEIEQNRGPGRVLAPPEPKTQLERKQHAKPKKSGPP
jgi:transcriptional regulator with XRE-family HTH domain